MFKANAEACNGSFNISSKIGVGTDVYAAFQHSHIDRVPLGDIVATIITIVASNPDLDLVYEYNYNGRKFTLNTEEINKTLDDVPINNPLVLEWLKGFLQENMEQVKQ